MDSSIEKELRAGRSVIVGTKGTSMRPLLKEGITQVLISPICKPLQIGDLPLVRLNEKTCRLHRLVKMDESGMYTRGDNTVALEKITPDSILGVVTEIYKGEKKLDLHSGKYRFYMQFWKGTTPFRLLFLRSKMAVYRCGSKVKHLFDTK